MQTNNRLFDDLAKVLTGAAGAAQGIRTEAGAALRAQIERIVNDLDLVPRDEFEAVKAMAVAAREENMRLQARLDAFEARFESLNAGKDQEKNAKPRDTK